MGWTTPRTWATGELVTAVLLNEQMRDNLSYLHVPNHFEVQETTGTYATTSATLVAVHANYTKNITLSGGHLLVGVVAYMATSVPGTGTGQLVIDVDGTPYVVANLTSAYKPIQVGWTYLITGLSAASHTVTLKYQSDGTRTLTIDKAGWPLTVWGVEI